eukprot:Nitzschia sp. Nitz4//scaffold30_size153850//139111//139818//NITZ4_002799-RA/size153850-processed-gene-0.25-mRNA-1//1//CDS//3329547327//1174//frame0
MAPMNATSFNNMGAQLLQDGENAKAIQLLIHALKVSKETVDDVVVERKAKRRRPNPEISAKHTISPMVETKKKLFSTPSPSTEAFLFKRPMRIETPQLSDGTTLPQVVVSSVIIFNLALANHMIAQGTKHDVAAHNDYLRRAIRLYRCSYDLLATAPGSEPDVLLLIAALNNLGRACIQLGETNEAQDYFQRLLAVVMFLLDYRTLDEVPEAEGFLSSVIPLMIPPSQSRPAAAA